MTSSRAGVGTLASRRLARRRLAGALSRRMTLCRGVRNAAPAGWPGGVSPARLSRRRPSRAGVGTLASAGWPGGVSPARLSRRMTFSRTRRKLASRRLARRRLAGAAPRATSLASAERRPAAARGSTRAPAPQTPQASDAASRRLRRRLAARLRERTSTHRRHSASVRAPHQLNCATTTSSPLQIHQNCTRAAASLIGSSTMPSTSSPSDSGTRSRVRSRWNCWQERERMLARLEDSEPNASQLDRSILHSLRSSTSTSTMAPASSASTDVVADAIKHSTGTVTSCTRGVSCPTTFT